MSERNVFPANGITEIFLELVDGDLDIMGWGQNEVEIDSDDEDPIFTTEGSRISIMCSGDMALRLPQNLGLRIAQVQGDTQVRNVFGAVNLDMADGDVDMNNVGVATVGEIHGDLQASNVHGAFQAGNLHGDTRLNNIHGNCQVHHCDGDLDLNNIHGNCELGNCDGDCKAINIFGNLSVNSEGDGKILSVHGNVRANAGGDLEIDTIHGNVEGNASGDVELRIPSLEGNYQVRAGGDIDCRLPMDANARLRLQAGGEINARKLAEVPIVNGNVAEFVMGGGGSQINLSAGGDITLSSQGLGRGLRVDVDFDGKTGDEIAAAASDFARNLVSQVELGLRSLTRSLDSKLSNLGTSEEIAGRVHEKVQMAMKRAEEKIAEASKEAERRGREAEKRIAEMERRQQRGRPGAYWGTPPVPPVPPRPPKAKSTATEEERLMVLRMVSEGKISVEQAEQLLAALNG